MSDRWEKDLQCALACSRCNKAMRNDDHRILSVYDHQPICMPCKKEEEQRADYQEVSKNTIGSCMAESESMYSDPGGYCYYHFYPFKC